MAYFTCITENRESTYLSQHEAACAEEALHMHIGKLPFDDGTGPFDEELEWLQAVVSGAKAVEVLPVGDCKSTWFWLDGARFDPPYTPYIVKTELEA
ncbi:MAG: hypothetical protein WD065_05315 [Planctomycetaceae bacterium]